MCWSCEKTSVQTNPPVQGDPFAVPGTKSGSAYDGTSPVQSAIISTDSFGPGTIKSFELVFTKAGTYNYICLLHADQGMVGQVVVAPRGTGAPLPPNTGSDAAVDESGLNGWFVVIGAMLLAVSVGGASAIRARR